MVLDGDRKRWMRLVSRQHTSGWSGHPLHYQQGSLAACSRTELQGWTSEWREVWKLGSGEPPAGQWELGGTKAWFGQKWKSLEYLEELIAELKAESTFRYFELFHRSSLTPPVKFRNLGIIFSLPSDKGLPRLHQIVIYFSLNFIDQKSAWTWTTWTKCPIRKCPVRKSPQIYVKWYGAIFFACGPELSFQERALTESTLWNTRISKVFACVLRGQGEGRIQRLAGRLVMFAKWIYVVILGAQDVEI